MTETRERLTFAQEEAVLSELATRRTFCAAIEAAADKVTEGDEGISVFAMRVAVAFSKLGRSLPDGRTLVGELPHASGADQEKPE